jgi:hypothetical protein
MGDHAERSLNVRDLPTFERSDDGTLLVTLHHGEIDLLGEILRELRVLVEMPPGENAVSSRLYPRAYLDPTEEDAEQQWQGFVHDDLVLQRVAALDDITRALAVQGPSDDTEFVRVTLDEDTEARLLTVLNDARLAFGTIADVGEEFDEEDLELTPSDPRWHLLRTYAYLTELQAELVEVMLAEVPAEPPE